MRQRTRHLIALGAVTALTAGTGLAAIGAAQAATVPKTALGLSSNGKNLSIFDLSTAKRTKALGQAKGLTGDVRLIGIDERPADHKAYGVGDKGGVYVINRGNGDVRKVSQLSVALDGTHFGVDFNPAADRLRIISDSGQSLRHDVTQPAATTAVDGKLNYDGATATGITAAGYTNSDNDPRSGTTLFNLDMTRDQVVQQVPANSGNLLVSGPFGPRQGPVAGFDIVGSNQGTRTVDNTGYASIRPTSGGLATLYSVNLLSGKFTKVAKFDKDIADLAIPQP
ncbi:DUF4394 domain-containing protein [Aeromicrobium fastidiosum]|uniref:DUF4394 domain-containing protein n=1 Tax=Aeromicrobium fastidiosum TaxID=52699 RepID=A0A641AIJ6_9ACTN|nr:DUF4394 domain-containing protein [Aeromicrobium fastidiosum]KAA1374703.1 DUF4394 domain-containing protein [Aeromicrobium fastidiosum]MBP2390750.1 hypothetical protein [Aeromicrobium fastidiosum]